MTFFNAEYLVISSILRFFVYIKIKDMDFKELKERQGWSLDQKIDHSLGVIDQFVSRLGIDHVYVSFSGGKDSTIVLWLARKLYPEIKAVFCNTGNEFPDIVRFVREERDLRGANIEIIQPKMKPKEVLERYGFPLVSKEVSGFCKDYRVNKESVRARRADGRLKTKYNGEVPNKWKYLFYEPYMTSGYCCNKLKKEPFRLYEKVNNVSPILGIMADESSQRTTNYVRNGGCNVFSDGGTSKSMPLSIWLEQDIWDCIGRYKIPIADIYYKGQKRTGCMFCGFGAAFKDDYRFNVLYKLYPKWYDKFMKYENNGVTYREALRKMMMVNGKYLPDEEPLSLFSDKDFD